MKCEHIAKKKEGAKPLKSGLFAFGDLECAKCGTEWGDVMGMTEEQKKVDKKKITELNK